MVHGRLYYTVVSVCARARTPVCVFILGLLNQTTATNVWRLGWAQEIPLSLLSEDALERAAVFELSVAQHYLSQSTSKGWLQKTSTIGWSDSDEIFWENAPEDAKSVWARNCLSVIGRCSALNGLDPGKRTSICQWLRGCLFTFFQCKPSFLHSSEITPRPGKAPSSVELKAANQSGRCNDGWIHIWKQLNY